MQDKPILIDIDARKKLTILKAKKGFKNYTDVIHFLINNYSIKEKDNLL